MSDELHSERREDVEPTPRWFKLEKRAMVAELRLLVVGSVFLNQFLSAVDIPTSVAAVPVLAWGVKLGLGALLAARGA